MSVALRTELKAGEIYLFLLKKKKRKIISTEKYVKVRCIQKIKCIKY